MTQVTIAERISSPLLHHIAGILGSPRNILTVVELQHNVSSTGDASFHCISPGILEVSKAMVMTSMKEVYIFTRSIRDKNCRQNGL
jgi:hypothetical protein